MDRDERSDDELIYLYHQGNEEALMVLIERYRSIIRMIVSSFNGNHWMKYYGFDDLCQMGELCFYRSLDAFRDDKSCSFYTFFSICLNRYFKTQMSKSRNYKNRVMY